MHSGFVDDQLAAVCGEKLRQQVVTLREKETDPENYHLAVSGYLSEIDRMNLEVRGYFARRR